MFCFFPYLLILFNFTLLCLFYSFLHYCYYYNYNFQYHNQFSTFYPNCFPRQNILRRASAYYARHRQVLTYTEKSFSRKVSVLCDKKISEKHRDTPPPLIHKASRYQKLQEGYKGFATKNFGTFRQKMFDEK